VAESKLERMFNDLLKDYEQAQEACINEFATYDSEEQQEYLEKDIAQRKREFKESLTQDNDSTLWKVTPDYIDYDLFDGGLVVAGTKQEAECLADKELKSKDNSWAWKDEKPQVWTAWKIETLDKGLLFSSFNAG